MELTPNEITEIKHIGASKREMKLTYLLKYDL